MQYARGKHQLRPGNRPLGPEDFGPEFSRGEDGRPYMGVRIDHEVLRFTHDRRLTIRRTHRVTPQDRWLWALTCLLAFGLGFLWAAWWDWGARNWWYAVGLIIALLAGWVLHRWWTQDRWDDWPTDLRRN